MKYNKNWLKKGFTLLEILVVIGIIAIIVGVVSVSYSTAQRKARDAKRQSDLNTFQKAIEQCYTVNGYAYPTITLSNLNLTISFTCPAATGPSSTITDPTTKTYTLVQDTVANTYTVTSTLEIGSTTFSVSNQQ